MTLLKVIDAKYIDNYELRLSFNDGVKGVVDLKEKVFTDHRTVFKPLQEVEFFKKFTRNRWTIEWQNGVDIAPEFLHKLTVEQHIKNAP
ncbi:MAG: DUF2442 domain-containing protein [Ekhidna sp.]|nr:DUF2442 domain-containing protein [Ekhidna sp.]